MRSHTARLYATAAMLAVFFVLWAAIAARPWGAPAASAEAQPDPRLVALDRRERQLRREAVRIKQDVDRRWAAYRTQLRARQAAIAVAKQRHARALAAAAAAQARIDALRAEVARKAQQAQQAQQPQPTQQLQAAPAAVSRVPAPLAPVRAAPAPAAVVAAVPAPPPVQIVTLPPATAPATRSTSSRP